MSAVSKNVMPVSRAAWTTRTDSGSSMRIPKLLHPRPTSETSSVPILRICMTADRAGKAGTEEGPGGHKASRPATSCRLVDGEAVQKSGAARADEVRLAAAAARVRGVPRSIAAALLVRMAELSATLPVCVARPIRAGMVHAVCVGAAVRLGTGKDVVLVGHVADAVGHRALLAQRDLLAEGVAHPSLVERISVELGHVLTHTLTALIEPRTVADAIARVDGSRALSAEVGVPHGFAPTRGSCHLLAIGVGAGQTAVIGAVTLRNTGDEERHRTSGATPAGGSAATLSGALSRRGRLLSKRNVGTQDHRHR